MQDRLPGTWIPADVEPSEFFGRLEQVAHDLGLRVERRESPSSKQTVTDIFPAGYAQGGRFGQLVLSPKAGRIECEVRDGWSRRPVRYSEYLSATRAFFTPVVRAHNLRYGSRRRLSIESQATLEPRLQPALAAELARFVEPANKQVLHPLDWKRFYHFIRYCHSRRLKVSEEDLSRVLESAGFEAEDAEHLAGIYGHCRNVL